MNLCPMLWWRVSSKEGGGLPMTSAEFSISRPRRELALCVLNFKAAVIAEPYETEALGLDQQNMRSNIALSEGPTAEKEPILHARTPSTPYPPCPPPTVKDNRGLLGASQMPWAASPQWPCWRWAPISLLDPSPVQLSWRLQQRFWISSQATKLKSSPSPSSHSTM